MTSAADTPTDLPSANSFARSLPNAETVFTILSAGALATVAFDLFGQWLSPALGFSKLAPVPLASSSLKAVFGMHFGAGYLVHVLTGLIAYPAAYFLAVRPLWRRFAPRLPELAVGAIYGAALWVFALFVMAHLVAGMAPFLGFSQIAWVALVGHVLFGVVIAAVASARAAR